MPKGIYQHNRRNIKQNKEIIYLRGKQHSYGEIAKKLKITRNQVAGVIHRYYHGTSKETNR